MPQYGNNVAFIKMIILSCPSPRYKRLLVHTQKRDDCILVVAPPQQTKIDKLSHLLLPQSTEITLLEDKVSE